MWRTDSSTFRVSLFPGEAVVYDPSQAYQNFFHTLGHSCHSTALAFDGMMFVRDNLAALCEAKLMQKFFPSLFKVNIFPWIE